MKRKILMFLALFAVMAAMTGIAAANPFNLVIGGGVNPLPLLPGGSIALDLTGNAFADDVTVPGGAYYDLTYTKAGVSGSDAGDVTVTFDSGSPGIFNPISDPYTDYGELIISLSPAAPVGNRYIIQIFADPSETLGTVEIESGGNSIGVISVPPGSISGMKFLDLNGNGTKDADEPGLENWEIKLMQDGTVIATTMTAGDGTYGFTNLPDGTYVVGETLQTGWEQTYPMPAGTHTVVIVSGSEVMNIDFGNFKRGKISGMKFLDLNGNGTKDVDEPGLADWEIKLTMPDGTVIATTMTDANGNYSFTNLAAGTYVVGETLQTGWEQTYPLPAGTHTVVIVSGSEVMEKDFGNRKLVTKLITRTQGYWATHYNFSNATWQNIPVADRIIESKNLGDGAELMGGFWSSIAKKTDGTKRSPLDQARMILAQQLLAAMLNVQAFGTSDGGLIAQGKAAFAGTDRTDILNKAAALAAFNSGGDGVPIPIEEAANPATAKAIANKIFWDSLP